MIKEIIKELQKAFKIPISAGDVTFLQRRQRQAEIFLNYPTVEGEKTWVKIV